MREILPFLLVVAFAWTPVRAQVLLHELSSRHEEFFGSFGWSVAGIPDVDGDGRGDFIAGAVFESAGASAAGRAYVFSGATGAVLHELASPNGEPDGFFGASVAGIPDLDGDGRGDLLVGASDEGDGGALGFGPGRAYVFSGASGALLHELSSPNAEVRGTFGYTVAGVEDVNGDGRGDLLVGAHLESPGLSPYGVGRAYVFSGATGALLHELRSPNEEESGFFGWSVAGVEDVDGDGHGDVLVGARWEAPPPSPNNSGRAYVFSGSTGALLHTLASPNEDGGEFGTAVAGVPDVDGDGRGDLLVGASWESPGPSPGYAGRAYVFSGATGALLHTLASPSEEGLGFCGVAVAGVEDADGDGRGDLLVGAYQEDRDGGPHDAGRAYVFGGATGALLLTLDSPAEEEGGRFGWAVSGVADADGDGKGDVVVGAPFEDPGASPAAAGRAYVFSGDPDATGVEAASPSGWALHAPRPNPAAERATVPFTLARPSHARLSVFDGLGREVAVLVDGERAAGRHEAALDGARLPGGVYVVRLEAEGRVATRRLTLVR